LFHQLSHTTEIHDSQWRVYDFLGFLEGVTLGTQRELRGSGLTGEFYALGLGHSNVLIALMNELLASSDVA